MFPILFQIGPVKIGSYGVMLALAFTVAFLIINREFKKNKADVELAWDLHFLALFGGMLGSRILYIIENFSEFMNDPVRMIFSTTGFSVLGGYILAVSLCVIRVRFAKQPFFKMADIYVPGMAIGYSIGRLGCIVAGDGCYGLPTKSALGMSFPQGLVPTTSSQNPALVEQFTRIFPGAEVPEVISVHPTPLYESVSALILFFILMLCTWNHGNGKRFSFFLVWFGLSRFIVEFIRLNPPVFAGLSSGQLLSVFVFAAGLVIPKILNKRSQS